MINISPKHQKTTYLSLIYGLGQKITFQANSWNIKLFSFLRTNITLTSSCCYLKLLLTWWSWMPFPQDHEVCNLYPFCLRSILLQNYLFTKNWLKQNTYKIGKSWRRGIFSLPRSIIPYQQSSNVSSHKLSCKTIWTFWTKYFANVRSKLCIDFTPTHIWFVKYI